METTSNDILKRKLIIKGIDNKSFKLIIIKEKDKIIFESNVLDDLFQIQYTTNLNISEFYEHNKICKKYKSIDELYSEIFINIKEKEIIMSLNNNKIDINLVIGNNKILFILEPKEIKLDNIIINKINVFIDILKNENSDLRNEIIKQKDDNEKNIKELKNEIENMKTEINIIKQNLPMGNNQLNNKNFMNMNMDMQINNMNMPINNIDMMSNNRFNTISITFNSSTGFKTTMAIEKTKTIEDMVKEYLNKIGLSEDTIGKDIMFMCYGAKLDHKSKKNIGSYFRNAASITVYDLKNIIPYWNIKFDASCGIKTEMEIKRTKTIKDMMEAYAKKIGFPKEVIGKEVIFLYNGVNLDSKANDPVENVLIKERTVTIFDQSNVIGRLINRNGFDTFNKINPNINNNFTNNNPNFSIKNLISRNYNDKGSIQITFNASTGKKVIVEIGPEKTIEDMIKEYVNKIGLSEDHIGKDITFLYNGSQLDHKSKQNIGNCFRNPAVVTVYDLNDILALWAITFNASTGNKTIMQVNQKKTIKDMMEKYLNKFGIPKEAIGKEIIFLYNGVNLDNEQNNSVESILRDFSSVTVYDLNNLTRK